MSDASIKLSPWPLLKLSWRTASDNIGYVVQIGWVGFLMATAVAVFGDLLNISKNYLGQFVLQFLAMLVLAPFAVAWHRFILLGEEMAEHAFFRFDNRVVIYAIYTFVIESLIVFGQLCVLAIARVLTLPSGIISGLFVVAILIAVYFSLRLSFVFPAIALGQPGAGLSSSFEITRGHGLQLLVAAILAVLFVAVPFFVLAFGLVEGSQLIFGNSTVGVLLLMLLIIPLTIIIVAAHLAFYTHCFILLHDNQ